MPQARTTDSDPRILGITVDRWTALLQTFGVSTALVLFTCAMIWRYVPPVVDGHLQLLKSTSETLRSMDETLRQSNLILQEVADVERSTKQFMDRVCSDHDKQMANQQKLLDTSDKILKCVDNK